MKMVQIEPGTVWNSRLLSGSVKRNGYPNESSLIRRFEQEFLCIAYLDPSYCGYMVQNNNI